MNCCWSTSASEKSVLIVPTAIRLLAKPYLISAPPVCNALHGCPVNACAPKSPYGLMTSRRPLSTPFSPCSTPAWETRQKPKILLKPAHTSSSFLRRIKRRKFSPQSTSDPPRKFSVLKGIAIVAVQPSLVSFAADIQSPSQLGSTMESVCGGACSSMICPSRCVPSELISKI